MGSALQRAKRKIFERHCHPWSAWTRWLSAPLVLVPVWHRSWRQGALVAVWFALNPVVFGKPARHDAFATRAMLGEELWLDERPRDAAMAVNVFASTAGIGALVAAWCRKPAPAAAATAVAMALLLVYWGQMAAYYERNRREFQPPARPAVHRSQLWW